MLTLNHLQKYYYITTKRNDFPSKKRTIQKPKKKRSKKHNKKINAPIPDDHLILISLFIT